MGCFPFFRDISGKDVLIVGGGAVALRRARTLAGFGARLRAVSPEFAAGFDELEIERAERPFEVADLDGAAMVIAATGDGAVNAQVARLCLARGIEVNAADAPELSTFQFPGVVQRGRLTVAVNTGGASPVASAFVRSQLDRILPENFDEILGCMEKARAMAKAILPQQRARGRALEAVFERCLQPQPLPDAEETECMIRRFLCMEMD